MATQTTSGVGSGAESVNLVLAIAALVLVFIASAALLGDGGQYAGEMIGGQPTWLWIGQ